MTELCHLRPVASCRCTLLALCTGLALVSGCDRDEGDRSVRDASTGLHTLTGGATTIVPAEKREQAYGQVVDQAKPAVDAGPQASGAGLLLTAQAQLGLADEPLGRYAAAEREFLNRVTVARSLLAAYIEHSSQAAAARQYDPAQSLADIDKGIAERTAAIAEQQGIKAQIDQQVAELRARAKTELDAAAALDTEVALLREQAGRVTAVQGEGLIRQAAEKRRAADARRMAGLQLQAQVDVTEPRSVEAGMLVDKLTNLKDDLESTRRELQERDRASKELAASAGAEAAKSAERLATEIEEIVKLRAGALAEQAEQAQARLATARGSAQKAGSAGGAAKTLLGDINQSIAELAWQRSFGHAGFAQLMENLAAVQPALPDQAKYDADAKAAREEEKKALDEAKEAFEAAKSAYTGSGARGEAKDRLERLGNLLEKSAARAGGEKLDLLGAFAAKMQKSEDGEEAPAPDAPAPGGEDLNTVLEELLAAVQQGQYDVMFDRMNADTPEKQQFVAANRESTAAFMRLDAACKAKLGQSLTEGIQQAAAGLPGVGAAGAGMLAGLEQIKSATLADLAIESAGQTATVQVPGAPAPWAFTLVDGRWLLDVPTLDMQDPTVQLALKLAPVNSQVMDELAAEVESGALASTQAVIVALRQKMMQRPEVQELMQQLQQGGPQ